MQKLFYYRDQDINRDCDPDLRLDRIFGCTIKGLDPQMLFDPFEEDFHPPAAFVKLGDGQRRQTEIVGQEYQAFVSFGVEETDPPEFVGKIFAGIEPLQDDGLVE